MNWTYMAIMTAAVATGLVLLSRGKRPLGVRPWEAMAIGLGAFCGGMIGAKLPFVLSDWQGFLSGAAWFHDGKTIVAGLVGGYLGGEAAEWALGIRTKMCDIFAVPLAAAIAVGRLGCFYGGCCYGAETSLPWGVDFGDGLLRHPTQLYEAAFHLSAVVVLYEFQRREMFSGKLIRLYFVAYFLYRFASEFVRPEPAILLGLTGYQWASLVLILFFGVWCCPGCGPLVWLRRPARRQLPPDDAQRTVLKTTRTLCPTCLRPLPGETIQRDGRVLLRRECPEHGSIETLVCADRRHYYLRDEVPHPPPAAEACCKSGPAHHTCVGLLEITGACNLRCPVCFAQCPQGGHRDLEEVCADLEAFLAARGSLDVLQISGGEPLLHPDLLVLIDRCRKMPIEYVTINTNGLELLRNEGLAAELARRKPRLEINLQFDGLDPQSHQVLRGADLLACKRAVVEVLMRHELPITLVATVVRGVNESQLGELLRYGLERPQIRGITFQPATWSGRFDPPTDPADRLTMADVIRLAAQQSGSLLTEDDFQPLPCSNPNCCSFTYVARRRRLPMIPLGRLVNYEEHVADLADRVAFNQEHAKQCCGLGWRPEDFFRLVVKPFMDRATYDQDRIDECCVHVIRPGGGAMSFCRFNALERGREAGVCEPAVGQVANLP